MRLCPMCMKPIWMKSGWKRCTLCENELSIKRTGKPISTRKINDIRAPRYTLHTKPSK